MTDHDLSSIGPYHTLIISKHDVANATNGCNHVFDPCRLDASTAHAICEDCERARERLHISGRYNQK